MARKEEGYRVFVGGLSGDVTQRQLEDAFSRFGKILDAQLHVLMERETGRPRGFGFLTYEDRRAMDHAIREMHGVEFGERAISVHRAKPRSGGEDRGGSHGYGGDGGGGRGGSHGYAGDGGGGGRGGSHGYAGDGGGGYASSGRGGGSHYAVGRGDRTPGQDECFKCGRAGHWARDCPSAALRHPPPPPPPRFEGFLDDGDRWFDRRDVRYGAKDHHYVGERRGEKVYDSERYLVKRKERDDYYDGDRYGHRGGGGGGGGGGGKTYRDRDRPSPYDRPTRRRDPIAGGAGGRVSSSYHDHRY